MLVKLKHVYVHNLAIRDCYFRDSNKLLLMKQHRNKYNGLGWKSQHLWFPMRLSVMT